MRTTLLIFLALIAFSHELTAQSPFPITLNDEQAEAFFSNLVCSSPALVDPVYPFAPLNAIPIPPLGINAEISYGANFLAAGLDEENFNFTSEVVKNGFVALGADHLRFPGGQVSNSFHWYTTEIIRDPDSGNLEYKYWLEPGEAGSTGSVPMGDEGNVYDHYLFEEGGFFRLGRYLKIDKNDDATFNTKLTENIDNDDIILQHTASLTEIDTDVSDNDNFYERDEKWIDVDPNRLEDFLTLVDETNSIPVFGLKIYDPLMFVMNDVNNDIHFSPRLMAAVNDMVPNELTITDDTEVDGFFDDHVDIARTAIENESERVVKRQMIKFAYEFIKRTDILQSDLDVLKANFESFMEDSNIDTEWATFISFVHSSYPQVVQQQMRFELANEVWAQWQYKFLPRTDNSSNMNNPRPDADFYAELCAQAIPIIEELFNDPAYPPQVGVVMGNRIECDWTEEVLANPALQSAGPDA